jgi:hypothetical protein
MRSKENVNAQLPTSNVKQGRECYHCKQWIEAGESHNCWTTTEAALTAGLSDDLREAWERLRETAVDFGEQRIYASLNSIMFSRKACYFFVRPKTKFLEVCFFLGRTVKGPQITRTVAASRVKVGHLVRVRHRDEVEAPLTDWMREAYDRSEALSGRSAAKTVKTEKAAKKKAAASKAATGSRRRKTPRTQSPARARSKQR